MEPNESLSVGEIERNLALVKERIASAALRARRRPDDILLVVVTKTHPVEVISRVIAAGATCIGESYIEEAVPKIQALSKIQETPEMTPVSDAQSEQEGTAAGKIVALNKKSGVEWHMIGHVQSRKARPVCEWFDMLHSLESLKLAKRLNRFAEEMNLVLPVLLECNVSGEESKFGWSAWDEDRWPELLPVIQEICDLQNLSVQGLMTMAPYSADPEQARPYFQRLICLRDWFTGQLANVNLSELSMGMSADFEVAVEEGSTMVRIGQAILPRKD